ncbi:hypothetical protein RFI_32806 [Reticulomyxa filosa]|uniref:Uncharacterized protein n=1 Tax=Reticulomyxa filosa TaxID=46433 RepID=X6LV36_RETFI|nr:hypothetical protein RFI_32806 [Reticulomyxa filosa]|eukprot:ETO04590.1 hypothetical protein RFI_32806 [Reticulomyxa filosa]
MISNENEWNQLSPKKVLEKPCFGDDEQENDAFNRCSNVTPKSKFIVNEKDTTKKTKIKKKKSIVNVSEINLFCMLNETIKTVTMMKLSPVLSHLVCFLLLLLRYHIVQTPNKKKKKEKTSPQSKIVLRAAQNVKSHNGTLVWTKSSRPTSASKERTTQEKCMFGDIMKDVTNEPDESSNAVNRPMSLCKDVLRSSNEYQSEVKEAIQLEQDDNIVQEKCLQSTKDATQENTTATKEETIPKELPSKEVETIKEQSEAQSEKDVKTNHPTYRPLRIVWGPPKKLDEAFMLKPQASMKQSTQSEKTNKASAPTRIRVGHNSGYNTLAPRAGNRERHRFYRKVDSFVLYARLFMSKKKKINDNNKRIVLGNRNNTSSTSGENEKKIEHNESIQCTDINMASDSITTIASSQKDELNTFVQVNQDTNVNNKSSTLNPFAGLSLEESQQLFVRLFNAANLNAEINTKNANVSNANFPFTPPTTLTFGLFFFFNNYVLFRIKSQRLLFVLRCNRPTHFVVTKRSS